MSTIKFEKGKFYKTRDGRKVECVHTNVGGTRPLLFAIDGVDSFSTKQNGSFYQDDGDSRYNIISEWHDERVVWVVFSGDYRSAFTSPSYADVFRYYKALPPHPANSLTRVVLQDGHVDTE